MRGGGVAAEGIGEKGVVGEMCEEVAAAAGGKEERGVVEGRAAQRERRGMEGKDERAVKRGKEAALLQERMSQNSFHQSR